MTWLKWFFIAVSAILVLALGSALRDLHALTGALARDDCAGGDAIPALDAGQVTQSWETRATNVSKVPDCTSGP